MALVVSVIVMLESTATLMEDLMRDISTLVSVMQALSRSTVCILRLLGRAPCMMSPRLSGANWSLSNPLTEQEMTQSW